MDLSQDRLHDDDNYDDDDIVIPVHIWTCPKTDYMMTIIMMIMI